MPIITETTLRFTGGYPPLPVVVIAFMLAGIMWGLYRRELKFVSSRAAQVPAILRSLTVFILVLALAGPVLRHVTTLRQLGRVVVAVDSSASMQLTDDTAGQSASSSKSRFHRAEDLLLKGATPLLKKLAETQDVELVALRGMNTQRLWWYRQGGKDTSGDMPTTLELSATSPITNLDQTLRAALGPATAGTALVLLSDGQHNSTGSPEEFSTALKASGTAIFTIGFGTEIPPPDLSLLAVTAPESVFSKENFQGRLTINDSMPAGVPANVRIESHGKILWKQDFITTGKGEKAFDFSFPVTELPPPAPAQRDKTLRSVNIQITASGDRAALEKPAPTTPANSPCTCSKKSARCSSSMAVRAGKPATSTITSTATTAGRPKSSSMTSPTTPPLAACNRTSPKHAMNCSATTSSSLAMSHPPASSLRASTGSSSSSKNAAAV